MHDDSFTMTLYCLKHHLMLNYSSYFTYTSFIVSKTLDSNLSMIFKAYTWLGYSVLCPIIFLSISLLFPSSFFQHLNRNLIPILKICFLYFTKYLKIICNLCLSDRLSISLAAFDLVNVLGTLLNFYIYWWWI